MNVDLKQISLFTPQFQYLSTEHLSPQTIYQKHETKITQIQIDPFGELNHYPDGLLDEWKKILLFE